MITFKVSRRRVVVAREVAVINVTGRMSETYHGEELTKKVEDVLKSGIKYIILDMKDTEVSSDAVGGIVRAYTKIHDACGKLIFCRVTPRTRERLMCMKLDTIFPMFNTVKKALSNLQE